MLTKFHMKGPKLNMLTKFAHNKLRRPNELRRESGLIMGYLDEQVELGAHIQGFRSTHQIYKTAEYELHGTNSDEVMTTSISESKSQSVYGIEFLCIRVTVS